MLKILIRKYKLYQNRKDREVCTRVLGKYLQQYSETGDKMYSDLAHMQYLQLENLEEIYIKLKGSI